MAKSVEDFCDDLIQGAIGKMVEAEVPMHIMIDRLATWTAYASTIYAGKEHTAEQFVMISKKVADGLFDDATRAATEH